MLPEFGPICDPNVNDLIRGLIFWSNVWPEKSGPNRTKIVNENLGPRTGTFKFGPWTRQIRTDSVIWSGPLIDIRTKFLDHGLITESSKIQDSEDVDVLRSLV